MKLKTILIMASLVATMFTSKAQTDTNAPPLSAVTNTISGDAVKLIADTWAGIQRIAPFTSNGVATVAIGAGRNTADKKPIYGAELDMPMDASGLVSITAVGAYHRGALLEGGGTLTFSKSYNVWLLHDVRLSAGDGVVWNFQRNEAANYLETKGVKSWDVGKRFDAGVGVVAANISDIPGVNLFGGGHLTWWFGGTGRH